METAIEIKNLSKNYYLFDKDYKVLPWLVTHKGYSKVIKVLKRVSLRVETGEVVGIIGKNGAGKTTLMKIIGGITFPTSGEVFVKGEIGSLIDLNAGFVQDYSGRENIYYKGTLMGMSREFLDSIIDSIAEFADIGDYFDLPIKTYSSGMKSRLGFSLAVFSDPDVLLIDEVLAVGDKDFKNKSLEKTKELFETGKSILFASHSEGMIRDFCTRVIYLNGGKIVFDGPVEEGIEAYNSDQGKKLRKGHRKAGRKPSSKRKRLP